ncbi:MAG: MFS transporter [Candidatus Eremiobacteraeota bacterium]|nr:MFS transporter [Candidatus Eremiobacteraeota bacterium]MBC5826640.1 MFS transporter [Candidatus Eremiobacteraeota bacterium]
MAFTLGTVLARPANRNVGFWLVASSFAVTMLGTTLPTPLYPIYERDIGFSPAMITVIFAVYALGVIAGLLLFARLSDEIGRRRVLMAGLAFSALSAIAFFVAHGLPTLFVGRVLSGLSAGAFTGTATAAMVELAGVGKRTSATMVAVAANIGGLGCGPLMSGILAQFAPLPLRLSFAADLVLLVPATAAILLTPETVEVQDTRPRWRVQRLHIPAEIRGTFIRAAVAGICGFAFSGLFGAVGPSYLSGILDQPSHAVAGILVFALLAMSAAGQIAVNRVPKRFALETACGALIAGLGLLAAAILAKSIASLFLSAVIGGFGNGLAIGFGLAEINENVEVQRAEVTATYFVLLYVGLTIPVLGAGILANVFGLPLAGIIFAATVGAVVLGVLLALIRGRER